MKESLNFLIKNIKKIIANKYVLKKQRGSSSYFGKLDVSNRINWKSKIIDIHNLIRIYSKPYLPCQSKLLNKIIFINKSVILARTNNNNYYQPGQIIKITPKNELIINCTDGILKIIDYSIHPKISVKHKKIILKVGNKLE